MTDGLVTGVGLIVDREQGLVAVDRNTVPIGMGEAEITFFGSQVVAGNVVFLHPRHNVALLKFDPEVLGDAEFEPLELASYHPACRAFSSRRWMSIACRTCRPLSVDRWLMRTGVCTPTS